MNTKTIPAELLAGLSGAVAPHEGGSSNPLDVATAALDALAHDLDLLWFAATESTAGKGMCTMNQEDIDDGIFRLAQRAKAASNICAMLAASPVAEEREVVQ